MNTVGAIFVTALVVWVGIFLPSLLWNRTYAYSGEDFTWSLANAAVVASVFTSVAAFLALGFVITFYVWTLV